MIRRRVVVLAITFVTLAVLFLTALLFWPHSRWTIDRYRALDLGIRSIMPDEMATILGEPWTRARPTTHSRTAYEWDVADGTIYVIVDSQGNPNLMGFERHQPSRLRRFWQMLGL